jgi:mRNA interferase RelE/StbE
VKTAFLSSFLSDVKKIRDSKVRRAVLRAIANVEAASNIEGIASLKRLSGHHDYFRIRVGDYRIGLSIRSDVVTFVRCLNRRDIYRFFP